jgi:hypothetical protein
MIIDDERDDDYDENYHTIIFIIAPPVTYDTSTSLITILQRGVRLTSELLFFNLQSDFRAYMEQVPLA